MKKKLMQLNAYSYNKILEKEINIFIKIEFIQKKKKKQKGAGIVSKTLACILQGVGDVTGL